MTCLSCFSSLRSTTIWHSIIVGIVVICVCQVPGGGADPCLDAVNIGDYRRSTSYKPEEEDPLQCDVNLNESLWYRFDAITGGKMPESCVTTLHCGAMLPIWMAGVHPTAANPGPKSVKVCAPYFLAEVNCCDWTERIKVLWCQEETTHREYFVYQLKKPPFCSMAYCAGDGLACSKDCSWNGVKKACSCPAYPVMTAPILEEPRLVTGMTKVLNPFKPGELFYPTRFVVHCVIGYTQQQTDDGARFDVIFEVDGLRIANFNKVNSMSPVASLDESYLIGHIGGTLTCRVASHWDSSDAGSKYLFSNKRWFGLSPVDEAGSPISNNLVVKEGQTVSFWMVPSFPITTRPCFDVTTIPCYYRSYRFSIHASEMKLSDCTLVVTQSTPRSGRVEISPIPTIGGRPKPFIWQLNFDAYNETIMNLQMSESQRNQLTPIFKNYQIQSINIEIVDPDPQPVCRSIGDPHIYPFPDAAGQSVYYDMYSVGVYYLVRSKSRNLEIQARHVPCYPAATVSCNCGVLVREGNCIFGINACNQVTPLLVNYRLDNISPTGTIQKTPTGWKMTLPSGIEIEVIPGMYMHIYVTGLRSELTQYDGLCSVQGPNSAECTTACDRYRVAEENSFFNINSTNLPKCGTPYIVPTCECEGRNIDKSVKVTCDQPTGEPLLHIDIKKVCNKLGRAADSSPSTVDTIDLDDLPPSVESNTTFGPRPEPATKEEATKRCNESLRKSPAAYEYCIGRINTTFIIDSCILDCVLLGDYGPADIIPTQLEVDCIRSIALALEDPATKNIEELKLIFKEVKELVCPLQCSNRGRCSNGTCNCNEGYFGADCSMKTGQVPSVLGIISPVCDIRKRLCRVAYVQATGLASPKSCNCKMRYENDIKGTTIVHYSRPSISGGVAVCSLPVLPINSKNEQPSETYYTIYVSLSNDDVTYSQEHPFTVYDGYCVECSPRSALQCHPKPNTSCKVAS